MERILSVIAIFILTVVNASMAADYPTRHITLINPNPPGGSFDIMGRAFASVAEKLLGQPLIVVNKPGASGMIGTLAVVQAPPDGYTLGIHATTIGNALEWEIANGRQPTFSKNDLVFLGSFTLNPALVVVPYNSPWKTLADLIKDCKAKPDFYAFGSGGLYGGSHLPGEVLMRAVGIKSRHVPYKGGGPVISALVGGHVDFATQWLVTSIPLARGNKLRILAVQSDKRLKSIPEVPTVKELGVDAEWYQWEGIVAPQNTPTDIVRRLEELMKKVSEDKSFVSILENQGAEIRFMHGGELVKYCELESRRRLKLYKELLEEKK